MEKHHVLIANIMIYVDLTDKISGYEYRKLIKKKDEEVWKMLRREVHLENEDTEENVADIDEKEVETTKNNEETTDEKVNEGNIDKHIDDTEGGV